MLAINITFFLTMESTEHSSRPADVHTHVQCNVDTDAIIEWGNVKQILLCTVTNWHLIALLPTAHSTTLNAYL